MEIPCLTWSHLIQDKLKNSFYLSVDKYKCIKFIKSCIHDLISYYEFTCCIENSVDPWIYNVYKRVDILVSYCFRKCKLFKLRKVLLICTIGQANFFLDKYIMAIYLSLDK